MKTFPINRPTRYLCAQMILQASINHHIPLTMPRSEFSKLIREMDYEKLADLAFLSISEISADEWTKACNLAGIE